MLGTSKDILSLAASTLTELFESSFDDGLIPAAMKKVKEHFKGSDTLPRYYNQAVKRSLLSLEIALKGPRAYYPTREKEFYQKHFRQFEEQIFASFANELMDSGRIQSVEELRDHCIEDCNKLKQSSQVLLIRKLHKNDLQEFISPLTSCDPNLSRQMLSGIQEQAHCSFLISLLERENVLLQGILFHFHAFLQSDPRLSNYVNYLEMTSVNENLRKLQDDLSRRPENPVLQRRLDRLEQSCQMMNRYGECLGTIGKKLDGIYHKTVQTYEALQQLQGQMQSGFLVIEERLKEIGQMLSTQAGSREETNNSKEPRYCIEESTSCEKEPHYKLRTVAPVTPAVNNAENVKKIPEKPEKSEKSESFLPSKQVVPQEKNEKKESQKNLDVFEQKGTSEGLSKKSSRKQYRRVVPEQEVFQTIEWDEENQEEEKKTLLRDEQGDEKSKEVSQKWATDFQTYAVFLTETEEAKVETKRETVLSSSFPEISSVFISSEGENDDDSTPKNIFHSFGKEDNEIEKKNPSLKISSQKASSQRASKRTRSVPISDIFKQSPLED